MAARTLEEFQAERRGSRDLWRAISMQDIWNAATKAAEEKFTSYNNARDEICPNCGAGNVWHNRYDRYLCGTCEYEWGSGKHSPVA
jgi:ribosomal protein S27AE